MWSNIAFLTCPNCGCASVGVAKDVQCLCENCGTTFNIIETQTNEEWIKSLDTEQLADVFYMVFHDHADRVLNAFWDKHKDVFKKDMMEWLKQPHTQGGAK